MAETETIDTATEPKQAEKAKKSNFSTIVKSMIDGTMLTRRSFTSQLPFIVFLVFMAFMYITNRYNAEKLRWKINKTKSELNDLRAHSIFISSELMKLSRQTEVADEIRRQGLTLKESEVPPKKIVVSKFRRD